jgi:hypothetical protein
MRHDDKERIERKQKKRKEKRERKERFIFIKGLCS